MREFFLQKISLDTKECMKHTPEMSVWRQRLWPIYSHELKKFIPMIIIMLWVLFNYTVVRTIKDSILANAEYSSNQVLPWAKIFVVTPLSIFFVILYAKLSNVFSKQAIYYGIVITFTAFFFLFAFVIYPHSHLLNASPETILYWKTHYWSKISNLFPVIGYWTYTWFYSMAELWGNVGAAVIFWQFANEITSIEQAKRFYPAFGFWANLGLIGAGILGKSDKKIIEFFTGSLPTSFGPQIKLLCGFTTFGGIMIALTYWWMNKEGVATTGEKGQKGEKKKKPKLSISESFSFLMQSKYLGYITVIVLSYGIVMNLIEVSWKGVVQEYYADPLTGKYNPGAFNDFMSGLYIYTGSLTMIVILFGQNIMRVMGWHFAACTTPWVSLITGILFFIFVIFKDKMEWMSVLLHISPLGFAAWLGLFQNSLNKAFKYSLFDPTKEMAYIPLDEESKTKGKAAIDVIGGRAGKSGGGVINIIFSAILGSGKGFLVSIGCAVGMICFVWLWAVEKLSKAYQQKLQEQDDKKTH